MDKVRVTEIWLKGAMAAASEPVMSQVAEHMAANPAGPHVFRVERGVVRAVNPFDFYSDVPA
jgi:hypothetical protein